MIEIGRKIRSPMDEETGVATYSRLWGRREAVGAWWAVMAATLVFATAAAFRAHVVTRVGLILGAGWIGALGVGILFLRRADVGHGKWIENYSGLWTILLYLNLGLWPHWS